MSLCRLQYLLACGLSIFLSVKLVICQLACLSIGLSISLLVCLAWRVVCLPACLPVCLPACPVVLLSDNLPSCLSACLSTSLSTCQAVCLIWKSDCLSTWLPINLLVCLMSVYLLDGLYDSLFTCLSALIILRLHAYLPICLFCLFVYPPSAHLLYLRIPLALSRKWSDWTERLTDSLNNSENFFLFINSFILHCQKVSVKYFWLILWKFLNYV